MCLRQRHKYLRACFANRRFRRFKTFSTRHIRFRVVTRSHRYRGYDRVSYRTCQRVCQGQQEHSWKIANEILVQVSKQRIWDRITDLVSHRVQNAIARNGRYNGRETIDDEFWHACGDSICDSIREQWIKIVPVMCNVVRFESIMTHKQKTLTLLQLRRILWLW